MTELAVVDNPERHRYELRVGDSVAGIVQYATEPGTVVLVHTEIAPSVEGEGLGSKLVAGAPESADVFEERLAACGYIPLQASAYNERYVAERVALYRVGDGFPRVLASDVPPGVVNVNFSVQLAALGQFEVDPAAVIGGPASGIEKAS